ncbi:MAG: hypothetical protein IJ086_04890 [Clostridium sp.]|nr:hypothetical protein [Clostridium sp.]
MSDIMNDIMNNNNDNKEMSVKEEREIKAINENIELIKVIMKVFNGQVLYTDLQAFCINFKVFDTAEGFAYSVEKLIKAKVLKKTTYPNTSYVVLVAKTCVNKFINNIDDSIDFSSAQVRLNCFKNAMMVSYMKRPDCSLDRFISLINEYSTFLHSKNDIELGYKFFSKHLKLNDMAQKSYKCAMYRATKGLKRVETVGSEEDNLISFKNSFATFVNKNIYTFYSNNKFTFYILDVSDNLNAEKVGKKIGTVIGTIYEQVEQLSLTNKLDTVEFIIVARDKVRHDKIINSFRKSYHTIHTITAHDTENVNEIGKSVMIKEYKEYLLDAINKSVVSRVLSIKTKYSDRDRESKDMFSFRNTFETQYGLNINIRVVDANLNDKINMYTRVANIKASRKARHEKELEMKLRAKIEDEIYRKAQALYSAREEDIRKQIKLEYGIEDGVLWNDEDDI